MNNQQDIQRAIFMVIGAFLGIGTYYLGSFCSACAGSCNTSTCPLLSNPIFFSLSGSAIGFLISEFLNQPEETE